MTEDRTRDEQLADRLLAQDRAERGSAPGGRDPRDVAVFLQALLDSEHAAEQRIRRMAIGSWSAVVALVPLTAVFALAIRVVGDGFNINAVRGAAVVSGVLAILALFLAVLMTVAWLFRSRSASLAVIERRLAALEDLLTRSR
jgi:hypothetical protein